MVVVIALNMSGCIPIASARLLGGHSMWGGGRRQLWKDRRRGERVVKGTGMVPVVIWCRKAAINYAHLHINKRNLRSWRNQVGSTR